MEPKAFRIISFLAIVLSFSAAIFCLLGLVITGFYPGIPVLLFLLLIPLVTGIYRKRMVYKSRTVRRKVYRTLTLINLLLIPIVLWITFVITIDHIIPNLPQ